jgi:two-component system, NarL family, invasion response regulator UvrY
MIRVFVVDDHPIVRCGLKFIAQKTSDIDICWEAENGSTALQMIREVEPDVIVLYISLPDISGMEVLKQLHSEGFAIPVLILSGSSDEQYAVRALKAGASGFLSKAGSTDEIIQAVRTASAGRYYISQRTAEKLAETFSLSESEYPHLLLSDREFDVMLFLAKSYRICDISNILNLSPTTVSTYRTRLLKKMAATAMRN